MKEKIQKVLLSLFPLILPLPLPQIVSPICIILFFLGLFLSSPFNIKNILKDRFIQFCILFFFIDSISNLLRLDIENSFFRDIKMSFLFIPLLFFINSETLKKHQKLVCQSFVLGVLGYILYAWGYIADFYLITAPNYRPFSLTDGYVVYQLYNYLPGAIHHTYIGIYIVFAILIVLYDIVKYKKALFINILLVFFMSFSLFYIGGKGSFILLFLFGSIYLLTLRKIYINILFFIVFLGGLYLVKRWVVGIRLENSISARVDYYKCGVDILKNSWFSGIGANNFSEVSSVICDNSVFIPHNIFLRVFVTNGIFGLFILLFMLYFLFKKALERKEVLFISLISILIIGGMTEDLIYRQQGVMFFVFFMSLFYFTTD